MTVEELIEKLAWLQKVKSESNILEIKSAKQGCPHRLYDSLSNFSNQDEGGKQQLLNIITLNNKT